MKTKCIFDDSHFEMQRAERVIHYLLTIALSIMLESFRATPE